MPASACAVQFTPVESSIGGALIGISAATLLLGYGRLLGFSGILVNTTGPLLRAQGSLVDSWRVAVLLGLCLGGYVAHQFTSFPMPTLDYPLWSYAAAGLATGFGTAMGSGCTSGHGICGLGRLSGRSFAAVCVFVSVASATSTTIIATVDGPCEASVPWLAPLKLPSDPSGLAFKAGAPVAALGVLFGLTFAWLRPHTHPLVKPLGIDHLTPGYDQACFALHLLVALLVGTTAGVGLVLGGMLDQNKVRGFLNLGGPWDPSLACVMGFGASLSLAAHRYALGKQRTADMPMLAADFAYPITCEFGTKGTGRILDAKLLGGAVLFGVGWGAVGICPGPSIVGLTGPLLGGHPWRFPMFVAASILGMELADAVGAAPNGMSNGELM